jgi:hypothetical protein
LVIEGVGDSPLFRFNPPFIDQLSVSTSMDLDESGDGEIVTRNAFAVAAVRTESTDGGSTNPITFVLELCGNGVAGAMMLTMVGLVGMGFMQRRTR